jgi:hypothetical protein
VTRTPLTQEGRYAGQPHRCGFASTSDPARSDPARSRRSPEVSTSITALVSRSYCRWIYLSLSMAWPKTSENSAGVHTPM